MFKTIKALLYFIQEKTKIIMLKSKIRKMENAKYLDLNERIELRESIKMLQILEEQTGLHTGSVLSLR